MSRQRKNITLPADLIFDRNLIPGARILYAVLLTFPGDKDSNGSSDFGSVPSVTATHREIADRSGFSINTVIKFLNLLEDAGWLGWDADPGFPNRYFFTTPHNTA